MTAPSGVQHTWLDGRCLAMLHDLPDGTWFMARPDGPRLAASVERRWRPTCPVIVVAWPDGTPPEQPETEIEVTWLAIDTDGVAVTGSITGPDGVREQADAWWPDGGPHTLTCVTRTTTTTREDVTP